MNRKASGLDRVLTFLIGLALLVGGVWTAVWALDALPEGWRSPTELRLGVSTSIGDAAWWPWLLILGGVLLFSVGLVWFLRHFRSSTVDRLVLPSDPSGGNLILEGGALGTGLAAALEETSAGVLSARGRVVDHGGSLVVDVVAQVRRDADLRDLGRACDDVARHARAAVGRSDLACRVRLKVAPRAGRSPRVH